MSVGVHLPFSVTEFKAKAREITGIDLDDRDADEPLTELVHSYNTDAQLHLAGAAAITDFLLGLLCNRLRMQRDFINHPEIADQEVKTPLFLWGMPRTGSTKSHKLFAASGDFNWLTFWQSHNPALFTGERDESPEPRIQNTERFSKWFSTASPDTLHIHPLLTHEPEEETFILMHSLRTPCFMAFTGLGSYLQWLTKQDMTASFQYLRDSLKYLQWQGLGSGTKPWLMKSPLSYGMESPILKVFPDAKLVMTHRHMKETIPSYCSTTKAYYAPFSDAPISYLIGIHQLAWALDNHINSREGVDGLKILDIDYQDLVKSPASVVDKVYTFCDFPLKTSSRAAMLRWNDQNPKDGKAPHKYSMEDFGLTQDFINDKFTRYNNMFDRLFEI